MDETKLYYFLSVARHLSFTKAAEDCHVVQSTVSKQVAALEQELGAPLLIRDKQSVRLTPAGQRLATTGDAMLAQDPGRDRPKPGQPDGAQVPPGHRPL